VVVSVQMATDGTHTFMPVVHSFSTTQVVPSKPYPVLHVHE
jgi:hypothetical protein